jgi:hypothetical protein
MRRIFTEIPPVARVFMLGFPSLFLLSLLMAVARLPFWAVVAPIVLAGCSLVALGLFIFRDIGGTASIWSQAYRESKGIAPDGFTFADVPTIKGLGFVYILMGSFFAFGALWTLLTSAK